MAADSLHEEWRPVEGWPYEVSNLGRVRRSGSTVGRVLAQVEHTDGYYTVHLNDTDRRRMMRVSRLVCEAFHGAPPSRGHQAAHNDGNRHNNVARNLRWASAAENVADTVKHGNSLRGPRNPQCRLKAENIREIRTLHAAGATTILLASAYGVSRQHIGKVVKGQRWAWLGNHPSRAALLDNPVTADTVASPIEDPVREG